MRIPLYFTQHTTIKKGGTMKVQWFYFLILMFIISCGFGSDSSGDSKSGSRSLAKDAKIKPKQAKEREDVFAIQRATEDPVFLTFDKHSYQPTEVSLNAGDCIYVSAKQFESLKISTGENKATLCGQFSTCKAYSFKIVKGNTFNKREELSDKPANCRSSAS